jgi:hypothetical protein
LDDVIPILVIYQKAFSLTEDQMSSAVLIVANVGHGRKR